MNLVKQTAKDLRLTYKELGEAIGYSESALNGAACRDDISTPLKKAIDLYLENLRLKEELKDFHTLREILKKY